MSRVLSSVLLLCVVAAVSAQVQIISAELGGAPPANMVHVDPWTGDVKMRVAIPQARNITHPGVLATHSPAGTIPPYTFSIILQDHEARTGTLIALNARTLLPTGTRNDSRVHADITGLLWDSGSSNLVGFETDRATAPPTHWFGRLDYAAGRITRSTQIPAPYVPRLEYDYVVDESGAQVVVVLTDNRSCFLATIDLKTTGAKPKIVPLPGRTCFHKLMWQPPASVGKPGTLLGFCQPEFPRSGNATLCIIDPATAVATPVSRIFHEEGDNYHTAVAFQPGWVFAAGLGHGRQWLFNYEAKNVTELHRVATGKFLVGGNVFSL